MPGPQPAVGIGERRLHLDVPGRLVDHRVDRGDAPVHSTPAAIVGRDADARGRPDLAGRLLRHAEVHVDRIERLQRDQRVAARQVLARD